MNYLVIVDTQERGREFFTVYASNERLAHTAASNLLISLHCHTCGVDYQNADYTITEL